MNLVFIHEYVLVILVTAGFFVYKLKKQNLFENENGFIFLLNDACEFFCPHYHSVKYQLSPL